MIEVNIYMVLTRGGNNLTIDGDFYLLCEFVGMLNGEKLLHSDSNILSDIENLALNDKNRQGEVKVAK